MTPAALRTLAAELRGPPRHGENLRAAESLDAAAAQLEALGDLRTAADRVVLSYDASEGPRWPAIETLDEMLRKLEERQ